MSGINNNVNINGNVTPSTSTNTQNKIGTPDPNTVNALQNQLNASGTSSTGSTTSAVAGASGAGSNNSADMKSFLDSVNQFCVQQGILTTPDPTDN